MPIYEYQCGKCGTFEATQRISDAPLRRCPTCKSKVTKLLSAPSFQFKGSGWYVTDYASKGRGEESKSDGSNAEGSSEKSEKKDAKGSESKSKESSSAKSSKSTTESKAA
jgi:putative FmdB family regulatory protein